MPSKRSSQLSTLDDLQLRLLRLVCEATKAGLFSWSVSETDPDWYHTTAGPIDTYIHFKYPAYNGDVGSDRDFVDVGCAGHFMIGTPGWTLALEILAAASKDWRDHVSRLREGYHRDILRVNHALKVRRNKLRRSKKR